MKKVLFITYYFPPAGGSGVQRPLKFVKYLRAFGWEPVVYTVQNGEYPAIDTSLYNEIPDGTEVIRAKVTEPFALYRTLTGKKSGEKITPTFFNEKQFKSLPEKISLWIRSNYFIPDARMLWIRPSVKKLSEYLINNPVDAIFSTGPPHSTHIIALHLSQKFKLPWIADFRDPWTTIHWFKTLNLTESAFKKHERLEKEVLSNADYVTTVSPSWKEELKMLGAKQVKLITNGFDEEDFQKLDNLQHETDQHFSIVYAGMLSAAQNPRILWKALGELVQENPDFNHDLELKFYGKTDPSVERYMHDNNLSAHYTFYGYLPHHEILKIQKKARLMLLLLIDDPDAKGVIAAKMFEFFALRKPVLCICDPESDTAGFIEYTKSGLVAGFDDKEKLKQNIMSFYRAYQENKELSHPCNIEEFSRKKLTGKLAQTLNEVSS